MVLLNTDNEIVKQSTLKLYECDRELLDRGIKFIGREMKRECYVHSEMMFIRKGDREVSKCGSCMNIVGPSLVDVHCIVTGFFNVTDENSPFFEIQDHAVASNYNLFKIVATTTPWSNTHFTQITISEATCHFSVFPSVHIVGIENGISKLAIVDANDIVEKILYNGIEYYQTGHLFLIPFTGTSASFNIISITNKILKVKDMDLNSAKQVLDQKFEATEHTMCQFSSTSKVFVDEKYEEILWIFKWHFVEMKDGVYNRLTTDEVVENGLKLHSKNGDASLVAYATTVFNFVMAYRELNIEGISDAEWKLKWYEWGGYNHETDSSLVSYEECQNTGLIDNSYWINPTSFYLNISIAVSKRCYYYLNSMLLNFTTDGDRVMSFLNIRFTDFEDKKTCKVASLYCDGMECTADTDSEDAEWRPECVPRCGVCRVGYKCSVSGKCEKIESFNVRSSSIPLAVSVIIPILLLFII